MRIIWRFATSFHTVRVKFPCIYSFVFVLLYSFASIRFLRPHLPSLSLAAAEFPDLERETDIASGYAVSRASDQTGVAMKLA